MQDQNFDRFSAKFKRNIYGSPKGQIRLKILWQHLMRDLPPLSGEPLSILDAGGGQGQFALQLAEQGHEITLCDISAEMLDLAQARFRQAGRGEQLTVVSSSIQQLHQQLPGRYPLVLCHAVLEWLADPKAALGKLSRFIEPGGHLSLMFFNYDAVTFNNVIRGNLHWALNDEVSGIGTSLSPTNPQKIPEVMSWLGDCGLELVSWGGVRVFNDYVRQALKSEEQQADLLTLEQRYFDTDPFRSLGRYVHFICRKLEARS